MVVSGRRPVFRAFVAIAFALMLSGCVVEKDADAVAQDVADAIGKASSGTGAPAANRLPIAGALAYNATDLDVSFVLAATDADGDALSWVLHFGDNSSANGTFTAVANATSNTTAATAYAANTTHAYATGGVYNLTLVVGDGKGFANRTYNLTLAPAAPPVVPMEPLSFSGSCTTGSDETQAYPFDVSAGQAFIHGELSVGGGGIDLDWVLLDPSGSEASSGNSFTPRGEDPLDVEAPAAGTWTVEVTCYVGLAASYDFTLTFN